MKHKNTTNRLFPEKYGSEKRQFGSVFRNYMFVLILVIPFLFSGCKAGVLVAPDNSILMVSVNPPSIPVGGTATVKVVAFKASGTLVSDGTIIFFSTDIGTIDSSAETENGTAYATFTSNDNQAGEANLKVTSGTAEMSPDSVIITINGTSLGSITLGASPQVLPAGGGVSVISAYAFDESLNPLSGIPITFNSAEGHLNSNGAPVYTDNSGKAEDVLDTDVTAVVTAKSGDREAEITVTVETHESPTADFEFSPTTPIINQKVFFNASASTPVDGIITAYQWDFGDGRSATGLTTDHRYRTPGTFKAILVVTDSNGNTGTASKDINVTAGSSPVADFTYSPASPEVNQFIYFTAGASYDVDGDIDGYQWNFGDGAVASGKDVTHKYLTAGTYNVLLVVTDETGNQDSKKESITVTGAGF